MWLSCIPGPKCPIHPLLSIIHSPTVVTPAVLNTYYVADPGSASGASFQCMQFLPFLSIFSYLSYLGHTSLLGLQTKTRRWATLLLSSRPSTITRRHPWTPWWTFLCMLSASARKSASHKKWHVLVPLDGFPCFSHHWIALELLYNMRLEPSFSIEWFLRYTLTNLIKIQHFNARFTIQIHTKWINALFFIF